VKARSNAYVPGRIRAYLYHRQFMMVAAVAGKKHHLETRLFFHDLEAENLAVKFRGARQVSYLDYDMTDPIRLNHRRISGGVNLIPTVVVVRLIRQVIATAIAVD
jgi:hypothetical protein